MVLRAQNHRGREGGAREGGGSKLIGRSRDWFKAREVPGCGVNARDKEERPARDWICKRRVC